MMGRKLTVVDVGFAAVAMAAYTAVLIDGIMQRHFRNRAPQAETISNKAVATQKGVGK